MRLGIFTFLIYCLSFSSAKAQEAFEWNSEVEEAYMLLMKFELDSARDKAQVFPEESKAFRPFVSSYSDFLHLMSFENSDDYEGFADRCKERQKTLKSLKQKTPYYLFIRAELYLHEAIVKLKFGDVVSAGFDLNRAYSYLKQNASDYPDFQLTKKSLLPFKAGVGTLPPAYQVIASLFGFKGELKKAVADYSEFLNHIGSDHAFFAESSLIYSFMEYHLMGDAEAAMSFLLQATQEFRLYPVMALARANLALHAHNTELAISSLEPYSNQSNGIPHLHYQLGDAYLHELDPRAQQQYARYLKSFEGESYVKDVYLKLGWSFLIQGNLERYEDCLFLVEKMGSELREEDRQALSEKDHYDQSNIDLLKARLLFDGGHYQRAVNVLKPFRANGESTDFVEKNYRLGRIYQALNKNSEALDAFKSTLSSSINEDYYKPAAAYYSGMIYENLKQYAKAEMMFEKCLEFKNYPYENSFSQKATAGLKRLEETN